jgi:hypothetical protein
LTHDSLLCAESPLQTVGQSGRYSGFIFFREASTLKKCNRR